MSFHLTRILLFHWSAFGGCS